MVADAAGRFRFRFKPDTNAMYLLSARYGGVEYFSPPVGTGPAADTALRLVVYDTSSTAPVAVQARNIVVPRPGQDGSRAILELIILKNTGLVARVAPDSAHPSWTLGLPPLTGAMEVGESDFSPDAVIHAGDSVKLVAPLTPGQKQLTLQYQVVPTHGRLEFPIGPAAVAVNLLVEERDAQVRGGTLTLVDSQVVQGRSFRRWTGQVPAGGGVVVRVPEADRLASAQIVAALVAAVALVLGLASWRLLRRQPRGATPESPDRLLDVIAALDARYLGREAETPPEQWQAYEAERARLKAALEATLAEASPTR